MMEAEIAHLRQYFLVRWMDVCTAECLREDGVSNDTAFDFATMGNVFVCSSISEAMAIVQDRLVNDELFEDCDADGAPLVIESDNFTWDGEHQPQYACEYKGEIVAAVYIEPLSQFVGDAGGPV